MCLRVIRHKAGATQPNEQTPALCSGPGDPPELLMHHSSEERREKENSLTRSQITAQGTLQQPGVQAAAWLGVRGIFDQDPLDVLASKDFRTRQYVALSCSANGQSRRRPLTPLLRAAYLILESVAAKMI